MGQGRFSNKYYCYVLTIVSKCCDHLGFRVFLVKILRLQKIATNSFLGLNEANKLFKCQSSESLWVNKVQVLCNTLKPSILSLSAHLSLL